MCLDTTDDVRNEVDKGRLIITFIFYHEIRGFAQSDLAGLAVGFVFFVKVCWLLVFFLLRSVAAAALLLPARPHRPAKARRRGFALYYAVSDFFDDGWVLGSLDF